MKSFLLLICLLPLMAAAQKATVKSKHTKHPVLKGQQPKQDTATWVEAPRWSWLIAGSVEKATRDSVDVQQEDSLMQSDLDSYIERNKYRLEELDYGMRLYDPRTARYLAVGKNDAESNPYRYVKKKPAVVKTRLRPATAGNKQAPVKKPAAKKQ